MKKVREQGSDTVPRKWLFLPLSKGLRWNGIYGQVTNLLGGGGGGDKKPQKEFATM